MKKNILFTGAILSIVAAVVILGVMDSSEAANLTTANNSANTVNLAERKTPPTQADIEAHRAAMEQTKTAVQAAIAANDYDAWIKAVGTNHPWAEKITKDNFAKFVEAYNLRQQADEIMTELGLENGPGENRGFGMGMGRGEGRGQGHGLGNGQGMHFGQQPSADTSTTE